MKLRDLIKRKIKRIKKLIILTREIKKRGGEELRKKLRSQRIQSITLTKESIKRDLVNSWRIGEIRRPDKEDWDSINIPSHQIPMSFLSDLKKKYWGGNIYNEL
jgi:hypothetical protein